MNGGYKLTVFRDYSQRNKRQYLIEIVECFFRTYPTGYTEKLVITLYTNNRRIGYELLDKMVDQFPENAIRYFGRPDSSNELLDHETLLMKTKQAIMEIPVQKRIFSEKTRESLLRQLTSNI